MTFRVSEIYPSIQGEGLNVGTPTLFVRFGGCNLRCPGWPCDTQHAIDPKYRNEWKRYSIAQLHDEITANQQVSNVCLTGGEPFLQPLADIEALLDLLWSPSSVRRTVECFSNGTLPYSKDVVDRITFCMDWKLPSSGEDTFNEQRLKNLELLKNSSGKHAVKFVIGDEKDWQTAVVMWYDYIKSNPSKNITTYAGVVWGKMKEADLAERIIKEGYPWKMNVQMHQYIYGVNVRGT